MTDSEALERFTALYDEYYRRVHAYAVSRAGRQLADEVTSEVFLIAWRRRPDLPEPGLRWLLTVARNVAASQFRASARQLMARGQFLCRAVVTRRGMGSASGPQAGTGSASGTETGSEPEGYGRSGSL